VPDCGGGQGGDAGGLREAGRFCARPSAPTDTTAPPTMNQANPLAT
jgi:hypothetical protein